MARLSAILGALATTVWRDQKSFGSFASNNFFLFTVIFLGQAGAFLILILGLVMLFPLSADPLRKIPPGRLDAWPLTGWQRRLLRVLSPWVNPVTWLLAALAIWAASGAVGFGLLAALAALCMIGFLLPLIPGARQERIWRCIRYFPGPLSGLVVKTLRGMVSTLDFYCAATISVAASAYRIASEALPPEASMPLALLIVLALSSYAQCLFGLDGAGGLTRYHLLPLRGWQVLVAKDVGFLIIAVLLTLPLAPLPGLAAALVALALGHAPSVKAVRFQPRWHFSTGASLVNGLIQVFLMTASAATTYRVSYLVLIPCLGLCAASTWWYGRVFDQVSTGTGSE